MILNDSSYHTNPNGANQQPMASQQPVTKEPTRPPVKSSNHDEGICLKLYALAADHLDT